MLERYNGRADEARDSRGGSGECKEAGPEDEQGVNGRVD